jgi:hypothetical protein
VYKRQADILIGSHPAGVNSAVLQVDTPDHLVRTETFFVNLAGGKVHVSQVLIETRSSAVNPAVLVDMSQMVIERHGIRQINFIQDGYLLFQFSISG